MKDSRNEPKVVFALTSNGNDLYSAMTRVAIASLRISNPSIRTVVVCDRESNEALRRHDAPLIAEVDEWVVVETPQGGPGFRSRSVKTRLRSLVVGKFLFLDCDVFVRGDLSEVFALDCDIAGAPNHSRELFADQVWEQDLAMLDEMGWEIGNDVYINSGVMLYGDTEVARALAEDWHRRWSESSTGRNYYRDQPALNSALHAVRPRLAILPDRFNAQIVAAPRVAVDATIWHYYSSADRRSTKPYDVLVQQLLQGVQLDLDEVAEMAKCRHPWRHDDIIDVLTENETLKYEKEALEYERNALEIELKALRREAEAIRRELKKTLDSKSWSITRPLRAIDALRYHLMHVQENGRSKSSVDK